MVPQRSARTVGPSAETSGDATPDGVKDVLSRAQWDADAVRDDLQADMVEQVGDPKAVLVLDD